METKEPREGENLIILAETQVGIIAIIAIIGHHAGRSPVPLLHLPSLGVLTHSGVASLTPTLVFPTIYRLIGGNS
ncbi:hypothetical protein EDC04DRAFT_2689396 [Pisolithus marmoratus]|nr:hypothetical protein EDC04DRAFT_2689396 [Pisolithus marmoratus]